MINYLVVRAVNSNMFIIPQNSSAHLKKCAAQNNVSTVELLKMREMSLSSKNTVSSVR